MKGCLWHTLTAFFNKIPHFDLIVPKKLKDIVNDFDGMVCCIF